MSASDTPDPRPSAVGEAPAAATEPAGRAHRTHGRMSGERVLRAVAHPVRASLLGLAAATLAVMVIVGVITPGALRRASDHHHLGWLLLAAGAEMLSVVGYAVGYRTIVQRLGGLRLSAPVAVRMVLSGFGMFAVLGGFSLDRIGLKSMGADRETADRSVLALGIVELAVLAIAACSGSIILLATGTGVSGSMLWPWALGVPGGATLALWLIRRRSLTGTWLRGLERPLGAVESALGDLGHEPLAWLGIAGYFTADIASLGAALRAVSVSVSPLPLLVAYASGFIMTRRTLPLGGAGVLEILLTFSLSWVGVPLAGAFVGVLVYRGFNLILIAVLAMVARHRLSGTAYGNGSGGATGLSAASPPARADDHGPAGARRRRRSPAAR